MKKRIKWILIFAGAIITVLLLRSFVFTSYIIPSSGMENTLFEGDRILVNKWSYGLRSPFMSLFSYRRWYSSPIHSGDIVVFNNPASLSEPVIDKRELFISRCIGVPGDTLILDSAFIASTSLKKVGPDRKGLYAYPKEKEFQMDSLLTLLDIKENELMGQNEHENVRNFSRYEFYLLDQALVGDNWIYSLESPQEEHIHMLIIPGKGKKIEVHPWNATLLRNTIVLHEKKNAEVINDSLFIAGKPITSYTFTKDYYWMVSNNSINLSDSRLFGLVPHDHIIGKATWVWFSKEKDSGWLKGYRWNRFFTSVK